MTHFIENDASWNHSAQCASFRLRLCIFLSLILCWHCLLQSRMLMRNCKCCVFKFLFLLHSLWLLASVKSHLLMNESRSTCSCLVVYWCRSISLFFPRCCMLDEICFGWGCTMWKRWGFAMATGVDFQRPVDCFHAEGERGLLHSICPPVCFLSMCSRST